LDLSAIGDGIISFVTGNPIIAVVVGLFLLFLLYRKPKLFLILFCLVLILAATIYFIMDVSSIGKSEKGRMIEKGVQPGMDEKN